MLSAERIALLKHGAPPRNALEAALRNVWYGGGGASYEKTVGPASIISISDAKPKPAKSLIVGMEPIQDLHGYDSPWPAGGGKNKINPVLYTGFPKIDNGITAVLNNDGTFTLNGTAERRTYIILCRMDFSAGTILNGCPTGGTSQTYLMGVDGTTVVDYGSGSAISSDITQGMLQIVIASGYTCNNLTFKPMIRLSSVADDTFAPYSNLCPISGRTGVTVDHSGADTSDPQTYPVMFPDGQTVYGGTVDVVSGVLTVTHGTTDLTNLNWSHNGGSVFTAVIDGIYNRAINTQNDAMSNKYSGENVWYGSQLSNGRFMIRGDISRVYIKDENYLSTTEFVNSLGSLQFIYKLATPQTYQLTPQQIQLLKGSNTLWSDADELTLTYLGTTPPNLLGGMLGGGLGGAQEPTEETSEEPTEGDGE